MDYTNEIGVPRRVTATGTFTIAAATNKIGLLGVNCGSVLTAPTMQVYQGQGVATGATLIGTITCAANAFTRIPAYCSGGAAFVVTGTDAVDLTIYWNPLA